MYVSVDTMQWTHSALTTSLHYLHLPCNENLGYTWMKQNTALSLSGECSVRAEESARSKRRNISARSP